MTDLIFPFINFLHQYTEKPLSQSYKKRRRIAHYKCKKYPSGKRFIYIQENYSIVSRYDFA